MNVLKTLGKVIVVAGLIVLVVLGVMQLQKFATAPREQFLQGQMEARRVLVAGKVPGRIERLFVHEGDMVVKDSIVAFISSPEIEAKKMPAQGALGAATVRAAKTLPPSRRWPIAPRMRRLSRRTLTTACRSSLTKACSRSRSVTRPKPR